MQRFNCYAYGEYAFKRYWSLWLLPNIQFTWISGNKSFHIDVHWLLWGVKLNTFWRRERFDTPPMMHGADDEKHRDAEGVEYDWQDTGDDDELRTRT